MKIQYLGTAAAEGVPALFCDCEVCRKARALRGKLVRTRSQALIDDQLLIDYPPDAFSHFLTYKIDTTKIRNLLITHVHEDHFYPPDFAYIRPHAFSTPPEDYKLRIYGSEDLVEPLAEAVEKSNGQLEVVVVKPFEPFEVGEYRVTALKATHGTAHPYIYLIEKGKTAMLYANDTGIFPEETIAYLSEHCPKLALVSFDCTGGAAQDLSYDSHMCLGRASYLRDEMDYAGFLTPKTIAVLTHFSHNGEQVSYDEFEDLAINEGFLTAYDGMIAEF